MQWISGSALYFLLSVSFCVFFFPPQNLTFLKTRQFEGFFLVRSTVNKPVQSNRVPVVVLFSPPPVIIMEFIDLTDYQVRFGLRVFVWK